MTSTPASAAFMAAHVPAGPPPTTSTSVESFSTAGLFVMTLLSSRLESARPEDDRRPDREGQRKHPHREQRRRGAHVTVSQQSDPLDLHKPEDRVQRRGQAPRWRQLLDGVKDAAEDTERQHDYRLHRVHLVKGLGPGPCYH